MVAGVILIAIDGKDSRKLQKSDKNRCLCPCQWPFSLPLPLPPNAALLPAPAPPPYPSPFIAIYSVFRSINVSTGYNKNSIKI